MERLYKVLFLYKFNAIKNNKNGNTKINLT